MNFSDSFEEEFSYSESDSDHIAVGYYTFFVIMYTLITLVSFIGNTIILIVILRRRRMRVVTNFFLANITIANLIYTVCAPLQFIDEMYINWTYIDIMCPLLPFFSTLSINVNTSTMIAASMERLFVIVYPFKCKLTKKRTLLIIAGIWLGSVMLSSPWLIALRIERLNFFGKILENFAISNQTEEIFFPLEESSFEFVQCKPLDDFDLRYYFILLCFIQYFLPMFVLMITYSIIAYYIYFINSKVDLIMGNKFYNNFLTRNKKKLIKMLVFMIICFNICWLPLQLNVLIRAIDPQLLNSIPKKINRIAWMVIHWLAFSHFCYNPFINGLLNKKFKQEIASLFKTIFNKCKQVLLDNRFYTCIIKRYDFPVDQVKIQKMFLNERVCNIDKMSAHQLELKFKSDQDYLEEVKNVVLNRIKEDKKPSPKQSEVSPNGKISSSPKASWNTSSSSSNTSSLTIFKNRKFYRYAVNTGSLNNHHDNDLVRKKRLSKSITFKFNSNIPVDYDFIKYNRLKYSNFYSNCNLVRQDVDNIVNSSKLCQSCAHNEVYYRQQKTQNKNINHSL